MKVDLYKLGNAFSLPEEPQLSGLRFIALEGSYKVQRPETIIYYT